MALDVEKLMAFRRSKATSESSDETSSLEDQIKMFEDIEDGTACRCPACMGLGVIQSGKLRYQSHPRK